MTTTLDAVKSKNQDSSAEETAAKVLFDSGPSATNDYPRTRDVLGSTDGSTSTEIGTGYGSNLTVLADFQGSKTVRYLRLASNGTSTNWWTIAEVSIYSGTSLDRGGWAASASRGTAASSTIDGDLSTRWTTSAPQASGQ